ncbi:acetyl-coenzyme A synthetase, cytoplasmic-like isoform X1 [Oncorhynchus tshawytscha]|uniref:Acetyl-coenzyme A synthetase n=1 Tax=Oncorhynchus tshawytscha TaxID=74940 RepID=A0AAZ3RZX4_ONCTS|nr:acetyl-coenzyme A synthetase, cytoplasmic-like isoform X1 [Oncorhynchus tshawytscha]XP_042185141.1 acetyl-coenzyme A synthetase, cytoplasmic-like isoform X1 [Oncorhynchus tshawytscha]XP_042185142.1 acetyl-coenzyme A synthetase, cytoplasmic-like isoform X1 [Oncorhynchus tshawytscha]XP_042185143.1 acetyl-coenzyme A synthetase, cytoplasmic-like isoform X1 [Oncorhynchus tshawytscha]XP_042185144.1 acetyl-coenzyme A synthetase, cytoplasmic-like isoform X1 [Oncorhynchus tshawytscha]XP_042185145.1 
MVVPGSQHIEDKMYHPPEGLQKDAHVPDFNCYLELYKKSIEEPDVFWKEVASDFYWKKPPTGQILQYNFDVTKGNIYVKCMEGATTNMCYNVLDRNVKDKNLGERVAFYWEGNSPDHHEAITYGQLLGQVCRCSNTLKQMGVRKGDRVAIYLPMIPELVYTMLACTRIGAVHSIVFAGFSAESLCERIMDSQCSILVTADGVYRGEKLINLKQIADEALEKCREKASATVTRCLVVKHHALRTQDGDVSNKLQTPWDAACDVCWEEVMGQVSEQCEPEWLDAEDPLFILYTSGSTGKPKGVLHTVAGYLLYTSLTFKYVFDHQPDDVYWCTADIGWITGHSYITYGPLANGATSVLFEGIPVHPHVGRFWEVIEKYRVTKFYTAPTAIRLLMKYGLDPVQKYDLSSLRILGTVGEPINPEAWHWYHEVIGQKRCPVVDTFWQTETGGHVLTPLPAATPLKPGSATFPFFGVEPTILNEHGEELEGEAEGYLVFRRPWPGIMRTVYGNQERFESTYFKKFPGFYVTGDGCRRDKDGYYWIAGRIDDMINVSGHLLSTAEVEASLTDHGAVAEAAVVSRPHAVKGECLYCFVTLKDCREFNRTLVDELKRQVREKIGPIATPDFIQNAPGLPKTRSGKIMRRVLRQIARNEKDLGDLSTMADPKVVEVLFNHRCETAS